MHSTHLLCRIPSTCCAPSCVVAASGGVRMSTMARGALGNASPAIPDVAGERCDTRRPGPVLQGIKKAGLLREALVSGEKVPFSVHRHVFADTARWTRTAASEKPERPSGSRLALIIRAILCVWTPPVCASVRHWSDLTERHAAYMRPSCSRYFHYRSLRNPLTRVSFS
jgi:hypothetical protein